MKLVAAALALLLPGCSWMLTRSPSSRRELVREGCPSRVPAGIDTYFAASNAAGALIMFGMADDLGSAKQLAVTTGLISAGLAVAHGASASYGFKEAGRCQQARNALYEQMVVPAYVGPPGAVGVPPAQVDVDVELPAKVITLDEETETETIETRTRTNTRVRIE